MKVRRALETVLLAWSAVALVSGSATAAAASFVLTEAQKREALRFGTRSVTQESSFDAEWRVRNNAGESVNVVTPFHRLALAARHSAFKNEPLRPGEPDRVLREVQDRLLVWAELRGNRQDFARRYSAELSAAGHTVKAAFVQNEHTALRREGAYVAHCLYAFPVKELTGTSRVSMIVRDADGREVTTFTIDLSTMR